MTSQTPLPLAFAARRPVGSGIVGRCNAAAAAWIERMDEWPDRRLLIWGGRGCGKSRLMADWADAVGARIVSGGRVQGLPPIPDGPVGIDDADAAADERALLHLLNACRDAGVPTLLTAAAPPARWGVALADLASRLRAVAAVGIDPPDDDFLARLLAALLAERQLSVSEDAQAAMLREMPRTAAAVVDAVDAVEAKAAERAAAALRGRVRRPDAARIARAIPQDDDDRVTSPARASYPGGPPVQPVAEDGI